MMVAANSLILFFAAIMAPAARKRRTTGASSVAGIASSASNFEPARMSFPKEADSPSMLRRGLPGLAGQSLKQGGRVVGQHSRAFVGIDTSKLRNAVAVAEEGRGGEEQPTRPQSSGVQVPVPPIACHRAVSISDARGGNEPRSART